ncbi:4'-phosphopantetheinyl transferase superfamily protein [bacterium]|nr:4'-phosphopantetheinyl transferase superfamily protein [bacterium]
MNVKAKVLISSLDNIIESPRVNALRNWLSQAEADRFANIHCVKVRHRWLAGRWLAKQAVMAVAGNESIQKTSLHIESRDACDRGAPPRIYLDGRLTPMQLSISHAGNSVAVAVLNHWRARLGIDVMDCRAMPESMSRFWLSARELEACDGNQYLAQFIWSLKEALYKAGAQGHRVKFSPRSIVTTDWISTSQIYDLTAKIRLGIPGSTTIGNRGALRVLPNGNEFATLITLKVPVKTLETRTTRQDQKPDASSTLETLHLLPTTQCNKDFSL